VHQVQEEPSTSGVEQQDLRINSGLSCVIEEHADSLNSESVEWPEQAFTQLDTNVKVPYLPPTTRKYTLVLDMDETLIHYDDKL